MCGIAGFSGSFDRALLEKMGQTIACRGPDGAGESYIPSAQIGLAHRRLAILDISQNGNQPMLDITKQITISFNGEIYNFRELVFA